MFRRLWTRIRCSQSGSVSPPLTRTTGDALRFLETQEKVSTWVTRLSSPMGVPGSVTPWSGPASKHHVHQTFGLRSPVERSRATSRRGRGLSTKTPIPGRRCSRHSWTSWSYSSRGTRSGGDKSWAYPQMSHLRWCANKAFHIRISSTLPTNPDTIEGGA